MSDSHQHTGVNICPALLRLVQDNGVVTFNCQLDAGHDGRHYVGFSQVGITLQGGKAVSHSGIPTEIYWAGDSRQEEWENTHALLAAHMKNPPTIEQIATWLPAMVSEARGWALWQTYMGQASQTYKKPSWLGE